MEDSEVLAQYRTVSQALAAVDAQKATLLARLDQDRDDYSCVKDTLARILQRRGYSNEGIEEHAGIKDSSSVSLTDLLISIVRDSSLPIHARDIWAQAVQKGATSVSEDPVKNTDAMLGAIAKRPDATIEAFGGRVFGRRKVHPAVLSHLQEGAEDPF